MTSTSKSVSDLVRQACRLEVLATKPGNVSPAHSFNNANVDDFLKSADAISPILQATANGPLGKAILDAVRATQQTVGHNTNLGIVLLLAPLCAVTDWTAARTQLQEKISSTTVQDATWLYEAIRIASPGGLGSSTDQDVADAPTITLLQCMQLAADRDSIALQYSTGYEFVFDTGLDLLKQTADWTSNLEQRLGWVAVQILAKQSDSLIARKCGFHTATAAQELAKQTVLAGWPFESKGQIAYNKLHQFLSDDGHRRNPGTTADLIAAILFCGLRSEIITCDKSETSMQFTKREP
ncbi:MAG: triphosphoribosyl-dephospho-CoA synthase [Fuerstiella sp.]